MNTRTISRSLAARGRAQLSPLGQASIRRGLTRLLISPFALPAGHAVPAGFSPRVLDRLQAPLTRFRD
jgi:hypothetical protein